MNKVYGGGTRQDGTAIIHWTEATEALAAKRPHKVTPLCGQASGKARFALVSSEATVNCEKCVAARQGGRDLTAAAEYFGKLLV